MQYEDPRHHSSGLAERRALPKGGHPNGAGERLATASKATALNRQAALHERDALKQRVTELWGPPKHYVECDEDRASFIHRMGYFLVYPMVLLASREQISFEDMPPPTRDVRAHECGLRLSRAVQAAMYERNAWNCMVGTEVVSTLDASSRGVLRWVGVPQQGGYTRMMAGVEWSVPPALRTAARSDDSGASPFFDGVAHGEHLFTPEQSGMSTLEEVTCVRLLSLDGKPVDAASVPTPRRLSLMRVLPASLPEYFWWQFPFKLGGDVCTITIPFLLKVFVHFISERNQSWAHGLALAVTFFLTQLIQSVCLHRFYYVSIKCGLQYRSALNGLIFEKVFTISNKALAHPQMNTGRIINMMSTDTEQANQFMQYCMYIWSSPMMFIISISFLSRLVGWCSIMAVVALLMTLPINGWLMKWQMAARRKLVKATDVRVKAANEFFSGVRIAKFMTWEPRFIANIEEKRALEVSYLKQVQTVRVWTSFVSMTTPQVMIAAVFMVYYLLGHDLTPTVVYPTISLVGILRMPFNMLPWVFTVSAQYLVAMTRINKFLECDDATCSTVQDMEEYWREQREHSAACQLAAVLEKVDVTAFVPVKLPFAPKVKTSLLSRALRMLCCEQCKPTKRHPPPSVVVENTGYVSPASASRHIVEGCSGTVHTATPTSTRSAKTPQMKTDEFFELEPKVLLRDVSVSVLRGKLTVVLGATGSGKSTLLQSLLSQFEISEGRVWAERSIAYVPQQAWIMNATVRSNILFFDEEDAARLADAVRVSQLEADLAQLSGGLETEIGEKGVNLSGGQKARVSLARAVYANRDVYLLDDPLSALDAHVGERVVEECFLGALAGKTRVLATHQVHIVPRADYVVALGDERVEFSGSSADFMRTSIYASLAAVEADSPTGKGAGANAEAEDGDAACGGLSDPEEGSAKPVRRAAPSAGAAAPTAAAQLMTVEEKASGMVAWGTYRAYLRFCGGRLWSIGVLAMFGVTELFTISSMLCLSMWTARRFDLSDASYLLMYMGCVVMGTLTVPLRFYFSFEVMRRGCVRMHHAVLRSVSRGTMEFFDTTPLGRILNRFSRDVDVTDNTLPMSMLQMMNCLFGILSSLLVTFFTQPLVIFVLAPCGYLYYRIMVFYNSANREIRRTSSVAKSPLFSLLGEALTGSATITAYHRASTVMQEALRRLDLVYSCSILENMANRWLGVRVEFLSNIVVSTIVLIGIGRTVLMETHEEWIALVSLSLTMATQTTAMLNWLLRQVASVEADMNSVERLQYYIDHVPKEAMPELDAEVDALERRTGMAADVTGTVVIEPASPTGAAPHIVQAGSLVFEGVQMRYREGLPLVLRGVSFRIAPREKVGIVGRTGSGKSTLLLTFMRMVEVCGGEIRVNGREIGSYGLRELRRQFSMIPQDPVLFDGTVRQNVDPFLEASSAEVWAALELVGLRERVASESEGIDSCVLEGGSNYSVGQRQLMCMARALLKKGSGFILMDEATANIDPALDRQIQATVMSAFSAYTVITIAHRLHTVAQYDKIIVMDHGAVAEMGSPRELVMNRQSIFHSMVEALGRSEAARVIQVAMA
ncbi:putative ATP-binding cassette protein subfamily C,member 2 [Leishmania major strain Friedlin]|uniref:Putative ATP-binding cassette protein subfamily C,member 2 n=1 Tax=Leishmania major TaxID=5664 RepID=Q4QBF3_LEIMA|nr:putative ATP-binding cassette protein subfamily C,member 2 [Leishmania major strain Friedlin]CAG9574110.1 pentamidine_resistance_protein_1 [Leishmania major strain Friedlin]CAJ03953.1 putative ATP-binding cassette protein subfamily C,member 2 [Leishmania major strain Friedlin]|eukprot:XP_001683345.1 putative ATP-binding cassette protein subfamily C,member 2 [Leishmania major strain Friedlin]